MDKSLCSLLFFSVSLIISCQTTTVTTYPKTVSAEAEVFTYKGRIDQSNPLAPVLAGPASYVEFAFEGDNITVLLTATNYQVGHTWAAVEVDGEYFGRFRVTAKDTVQLSIPRSESDDSPPHTIRIHHAVEPLFGRLVFLGARGQVVKPSYSPSDLVIFLGDSMTCGAASDTTSGPCNYGAYHDNTNAYLAFPARVGRAMDAHFIVHAVSGRGLYTNWNGQDPPLPVLLPYLYLDTANAMPYDMTVNQPVAAVVALGTNDLNSAPELRSEFDSTRFENTYVEFVKTLHEHSPSTAILMSTSVMHAGTKERLLSRILDRVATRSRSNYPNLKIAKSQLEEMELHGCPAGPHPSTEEHAVIATQLTRDLKALLAS